MRQPKAFSLGYGLMVLGVLLQISLHGVWPAVPARLEKWPEPVPTPWLRLFSLGEPVALAKGLMLWLQAFDYQAGVPLALPDLDRERLEGWLNGVLELDPRGQYPLLMAVRYYGELAPPDQQRRWGEWVYRRFLEDPRARWPWLAHAAIAAQHRLHDLPLALRYARAIRRHATGEQVPAWARQMEIVVLEEMGEGQEAQKLIESLLTGGLLHNAQEIHFWQDRLRLGQNKDKQQP
ncbi:MAG: hypothetical protein HQL87_16915 [Magnetococcales bacterium]|nr:hypothetical protein [Magnetococcales bacterium]